MILSRTLANSSRSLSILRQGVLRFRTTRTAHDLRTFSSSVSLRQRTQWRGSDVASAKHGLRIPRSIAHYSTITHLPQVSTHSNYVTIHWNPEEFDSAQSNFHYMWLRDHCRCSKCFHEVTKQRLVDTFAIQPDVKPLEISAGPSGLNVTWREDGNNGIHASTFPWEWLQPNTYDPPKKPKPQGDNPKKLWSSEIASNPPTVAFRDVMQDDKAVYHWLKNIDDYGFSFISGVPATLEDTEALSRKIGFIRETQYGGFWDFSSDLAHGDTAYTSIALGAHTDNTYYTDPCGLQLFHLIKPAAVGGHTLLVDGFFVADLMRKRYPELFRVFTDVNVPSHAAGNEDSFYFTGLGKPVVELDLGGEFKHIRWNNDDRSVMSYYGEGGAEKWYEAARAWNSLLTASESEFWIPLKAGLAVVIDNHRVLHGRSAFSGPRRMCGAYLGSDEYRSRLRVLHERFGSKTTETTANPGGRSVWSPGL